MFRDHSEGQTVVSCPSFYVSQVHTVGIYLSKCVNDVNPFGKATADQ